MTNEEQLKLIAKARELCEKRIVFYEHEYEIEPNDLKHEELNSWTTHLAEMDEHKGVHTDYGYVCQKCSKSFFQTGMSINQYPCDFLVTKVKRLLGVE